MAIVATYIFKYFIIMLLCGRLVWNTRVGKKITQLRLAGRILCYELLKEIILQQQSLL